MVGPRTMKMVGEISGERAIILIDSGATHNFINEKLIGKCNLNVEFIEKYMVVKGNRHQIICEGRCIGVTVKVQGLNITGQFLSMELGTLDILLGV